MTRLCALAALAVSSLAAACGSPGGNAASRYGTVLLESNSAVEPLQEATALFFHLDSTPNAGPCRVAEEQAGCRLWECDEYSPLEAFDTSPLSAGSVRVTGADVGLQLEEAKPGSYGWENTLGQPLWDGGERLLAIVEGSAEFPAMRAALTAPAPITLTAPLVPETPWLVDADEDLTFGWTGAVGGDVYVVVSVVVPDPESGANQLFPGLDCGFAGTADVSVVPAALLARVAKPESSTGHQIEAFTFAHETARVGEALLTFRATSFALSEPATIE